MNFLSYLINGISLGSVYAIIALGYTMVYGIAKMLNFAHGDVIMIAMLCGVPCNEAVRESARFRGGSHPSSYVPFSELLLKKLPTSRCEEQRRLPCSSQRSVSAIFCRSGIAAVWSGYEIIQFRCVPAFLKLADGALTISGTTIVTVLACVVIMIALMLFIKKTKAGQAMLAVSEDKDAAQLMGVNVNATIS